MLVDFDLVVQGQAGGGRTAKAVADAIRDWFQREYRPLLVASRTAVDGRGAAAARIHLHPVDPGVRFHVSAQGLVTVRADVLPVGPGFHVFLVGALQALGEAQDIAWVRLPRVGPRDASEHAQERLMNVARDGLDGLAGGAEGPGSLMLPLHERFSHDSLVATPLGPRDMAWLARAAIGGHVLRDVFPWPEPGFGPRYTRGRALSLMWMHVRWRAPRDGDERRLLEVVDGLMLDAWQGEPNQALPWAEWAEIRSLLGIEDEQSPEITRRLADEAPRDPVGYRRHPVSTRLPAGWWVTVPGELATRWEDRVTWRADGETGSVRLSVLSGMERSAQPLPVRAMNANQLVHREGGMHGAAVFESAPGGAWSLRGRMRSDGGEVRIDIELAPGVQRVTAADIFRSLAWLDPDAGLRDGRT